MCHGALTDHFCSVCVLRVTHVFVVVDAVYSVLLLHSQVVLQCLQDLGRLRLGLCEDSHVVLHGVSLLHVQLGLHPLLVDGNQLLLLRIPLFLQSLVRLLETRGDLPVQLVRTLRVSQLHVMDVLARGCPLLHHLRHTA
ncbi:hypothetical protein NP493_68g03020 [Ridgeia piscesae]|uniref:Uncharacterized protein n=1 Tax=Ridgeia piscesae TaxID=27915 RepID=A0AAD9P9P3_RIDPI|nr:hypothetical protein NP493_68g03020 [Ridgeia piscesae]